MVTASESGILTKFIHGDFCYTNPALQKNSAGSIPEAKRLTGWGGSNSWSADRKGISWGVGRHRGEGAGLRGLEGWRFANAGNDGFWGDFWDPPKWILVGFVWLFLGGSEKDGGTPKMHYSQKSPLFEKRMLKSKMVKVQRSFDFQSTPTTPWWLAILVPESSRRVWTLCPQNPSKTDLGLKFDTLGGSR